jgi:hypothetical protein
MNKQFAVTFLLVLSFSKLAHSWGGRGHHATCDAATHLIKDKIFQEFLKTRPHIMGHLCNIPDIHWKNIDGEARKIGSPTHYVNPEVLGFTAQTLPLNLSELIKNFTGKERKTDGKRISSVPLELGTNWWRADQLYRLSLADINYFKDLKRNELKSIRFNDNHPFIRNIYNWHVHLGIMGHFVADNAQPFHTVADYDGYGAGHGGIHSYYEEEAVSQADESLVQKIVQSARKEKGDYLKASSVLEQMRALAVLSSADASAVFKADQLLKRSDLSEEKGMSIRKPAKRAELKNTHAGFEKLYVKHMGRAAALLAQLWERSYIELGRPPLDLYQSFKHPFTPDFIPPDYYDLEKN